MIIYDKLWNTMNDKGISQYDLINTYNISRGQIDRLKKNGGVTTHTVDVLCDILKCNVNDIMEHVKDETKC